MASLEKFASAMRPMHHIAQPLIRNTRHFSQRASPRPRLHNVRQSLTRNPFARPQRALNMNKPPGKFSENAWILFRKYPIHITLATASILLGAFGVIYVNYLYQNYIVAAFHNYPEEVAKPMRRALYYTNYDLRPQEALKYYKQALLTAQEIKMDPFSDEVVGIRIQLAAFLEKIRQPSKAIEVLERIRIDTTQWLEMYGERKDFRLRRSKILAKAIAVSVKLGELYAEPTVWDRELAEERLVWAVESALREKQRRQEHKVSEADEGPWMDDESLGAAIESLAHRYESNNQHYLAAPLFLQALNLYPTKDCHAVILMNNLATSLAQQSPRAAHAIQTHMSSQNITEQQQQQQQSVAAPTAPTKAALLASARNWAEKALAVAGDIQPPVRTDECDVGCAVALHNLGEFAEMANDTLTAKRKYREAASLARAVGFREGWEMSETRLKGLSDEVV